MVVFAILEKFSAVSWKLSYGFLDKLSPSFFVLTVTPSVLRMAPEKNFLSLNLVDPTKSYNLSERSRVVDLWIDGNDSLILAFSKMFPFFT